MGGGWCCGLIGFLARYGALDAQPAEFAEEISKVVGAEELELGGNANGY